MENVHVDLCLSFSSVFRHGITLNVAASKNGSRTEGDTSGSTDLSLAFSEPEQLLLWRPPGTSGSFHQVTVTVRVDPDRQASVRKTPEQ